MPSRRSLAGSVVALAVLLGSCRGGGDGAGAGAEARAGGASTTTTVSMPATSEAIAVVLAPDRLVVGGNALVYGAPKSQVRAYLDRALGAPTATETQDCGPGRLESFRWDGITAYVGDDGFAGWAADDDTVATAQGIRIGSARAAVEAAYPDETATESSLGTEFFVPGPEDGSGISGLFEDGEVAALWSGATCVAR